MKKRLFSLLVAMVVGVIVVFVFHSGSPKGIKFGDFIPIIVVMIYLFYRSCKRAKEERNPSK